MKTFRSFRKQLEEKIDLKYVNSNHQENPSIFQRVGNAIKSVGGKTNSVAPPLEANQINFVKNEAPKIYKEFLRIKGNKEAAMNETIFQMKSKFRNANDKEIKYMANWIIKSLQ